MRENGYVKGGRSAKFVDNDDVPDSWVTLFVPIRKSPLLDQVLIFAAPTRGVDQVVLIGNRAAATLAILAQASAARRHVALPPLCGRQTVWSKQLDLG
ncbi:MAG: hypothetical protein JJU06_08835 [Ectothiorhodospiraceae bacterium]|nr:hypothetical protein [Ectothiorhodospiraceae bacterium]MCH8504954.1 hypothetical protein [Ectothiorhodospiraceae bacterium]